MADPLFVKHPNYPFNPADTARGWASGLVIFDRTQYTFTGLFDTDPGIYNDPFCEDYWHVFIRVAPTDGHPASTQVLLGGVTAVGATSVIIRLMTDGKLRMISNTTTTSAAEYFPNGATQPTVIHISQNTTARNFYKNGVLTDTFADAKPTAQATQHLFYGSYNNNGTQQEYLLGDGYSLFIWGGAVDLTDVELDLLESWFMETTTPSAFINKWNAVHNPICYKISNDKWPLNTLDAAETLSAAADDNGNVKFTSTAHTYNELDWVTIDGTTSYDGIWQIITVADNTHFTLDLAYVANESGTALKYYMNYNLLVNVYEGLPGGHVDVAYRPQALRGTLNAKPDVNNIALVDVAGIIKEALNLNNNPDELNKTDFKWTQFYIGVQEQYDIINTVPIETFTGTEVDDRDPTASMNLYYGVNAKMPFKNSTGGVMGGYVFQYTATKGGLFLTKFSDPVMWVDNPAKYFDVSAILDLDMTGHDCDLQVKQYSQAGSLLATTDIEVIDTGDESIYRIRLDNFAFNASTNYIVIMMQAAADSRGTLTIKLNQDCDPWGHYLTWINSLCGWDYWYFNAKSDYGIEFGDSPTHELNVFNGWDDNFINGDTIESYTKVDARNSRHIRSQYVTKTQLQAITEIKHSIKVQEIRSDGSLITVLVDKDSFKIRTDGDNLYMIEFDLVYTDKIPVQDA